MRRCLQHQNHLEMTTRCKSKNRDRTRQLFFLCVRDFEESDQSSSTLSNSTTRGRRTSSILEDQEFSSESVSTNNDWSDDRWKACLSAGGGAKRRYQHCSDISGTIVYLRALQGHSGRSLIDPSLQDNVIIQFDYSNKFTTLDVRSIFILSSTMD